MVLLQRLPRELWSRLKAVHFNDYGNARRLGYVTRGRREITLCAIPPRIGLSRTLGRGQTPGELGAIRGCQWPPLAIRRFMLYNVFLHELGHLQVVNESASSTRRKFADEFLAEQFARSWYRELWSRPFDHPDPVHNAPSEDEIEAVRLHWGESNREYKKGLRYEKMKRYETAIAHYSRSLQALNSHSMALERLGILTYAGRGTEQSTERSIELLSEAIRLDPSLDDATLFLALALSRQDKQDEARACFGRAMALDRYPPLAMSMYADALADWGHYSEAERCFQRVLKKDPACTMAIRDYGRSLLREDRPRTQRDVHRAIDLFERAVAIDPRDAYSHFSLGAALFCELGELDRARYHLKRALQLKPSHAGAAELLQDIEEPASSSAPRQ
jgi:tetratricopeptide (TPR) repeat protein